MQAEDGEIRIQTTPSLGEVRPHSDPVGIVVSVLGSDGKPLSRGRLNVRLVAPAPAGLFSTDFPLVEGSRLLEMDLPLFQGEAAWKYAFPIRGLYRLELRASGEAGKEIMRVFEIGVKESRMKLFYLGIFTAALFSFGFMAGRLFTGRG